MNETDTFDVSFNHNVIYGYCGLTELIAQSISACTECRIGPLVGLSLWQTI